MMMHDTRNNNVRSRIRSTTILSVRRGEQVAIGGDGQVSLGDTMLKPDATKLRSFQDGKVWCGFAGSAADAFALLDRFSTKLEAYKGNLRRAAIELAKEWRSDRILRRLNSLLVVANREASLELISTLTAQGVAVLAVFHDLDAMRRLASRVVLMRDGRIVGDGSPDEILEGAA